MKKPVANSQILDTGIYRIERRHIPQKSGEFLQNAYEHLTAEPSDQLEKLLTDYEHGARQILQKFGITPIHPFSRPVETPNFVDTAVDLFQRIEILRQGIKEQTAPPSLILNAIAIGVFADMLYVFPFEPYVKTGRPVKEASSKGHEAVHGTPEEKQQRWDAYQQKVAELHRKHPLLSYDRLCTGAAKYFKVSTKTIKRHTTNPHR